MHVVTDEELMKQFADEDAARKAAMLDDYVLYGGTSMEAYYQALKRMADNVFYFIRVVPYLEVYFNTDTPRIEMKG